jgi:hypothetical protein
VSVLCVVAKFSNRSQERRTIKSKPTISPDDHLSFILFTRPISEDDADTKIGDLIALLPSLFQGGQLQLHHAGESKSLNLAHQSGLSTSIVAAYSGVEHTLSGVTSGYRLSLEYDIVQSMAHAEQRPMLPEMQGATQKMHHVLLSWKQADESGEAPEFLACLLQHKYAAMQGFRARSLVGADALLVSHLYPLARALGFRIYLAHVSLSVSTRAHAADYGYGRRGYRSGWGYDDSDDDEEIDEGEFEDDDDREEFLRITRVVDLRGMPVDVGIDLEVEDLFNGSLTDENPDDEEFERYERTVSRPQPPFCASVADNASFRPLVELKVRCTSLDSIPVLIMQTSLQPHCPPPLAQRRRHPRLRCRHLRLRLRCSSQFLHPRRFPVRAETRRSASRML